MRTHSEDYIIVQKWRMEDAEALVDLCKDPSLREHWQASYPYPYTVRRAEVCIEFFRNANPLRFQFRTLFVNGTLSGWMQCEVTGHQCALFTYRVSRFANHEDILADAIQQMCQSCFIDLDVMTIYAKAHMEDVALCKALLRNGFYESRETAPIYLYFLHHFTAKDVICDTITDREAEL